MKSIGKGEPHDSAWYLDGMKLVFVCGAKWNRTGKLIR
jgi:hypothetical protein